jgi:hypothetical protein
VLSTYTVDVDQPVVLTAAASGGSGGYTYSWTGLPGGCASSSPTATCTFSSQGSYTVTVQAYDSFESETPVARADVTVSTDPMVLLTPTTPSVDLGQTAKFDVHVNGGAPGYSYEYLHLPTGCTSSDASDLSCVPTATATYSNLSVAVTDHNDWTVDAAINVTVYNEPTVALTVSPNPVPVGDGVTFTAAVHGGAPGDAFAWGNLPGGCQATPSATISCTPSGTGSTTVNVTLTDGDGYVANASATISVVSAPSILAGSSGSLVLGIAVLGIIVVAAVVVVWTRRHHRPPSDEPSA